MHLKTWFYLQKYNILKPGAIHYYKTLCANENLSKEELDDLHWKKLFALIKYAGVHSPFYRNKLNAIGATVHDFLTRENYEHFPVLTREDLCNHFDEIKTDEVNRKELQLSTTGGSSGKPVSVLIPKRFPRAALGWRMYASWELELSVDWARTYRNTVLTLKDKILQRLIDFPIRTILLDATVFMECDIAAFLKKFNKRKPKLLQGYVGAIDNVAEYILSHNLSVVPPAAIWVTSAPLSNVQRTRIEKAFQAPVYDQYGCCEVYWLATECMAHEGLHILHDARRIEFLNQEYHSVGLGQSGDIAITDLENYAFPIIRYLNGDRGHLVSHSCSCGSPFPLMGHVEGRVSDTILLPSGRIINGEFLTTLFDKFPDAVKRFHVHQNKDYSLLIQVVPNSSEEKLYPILKDIVEQLRNKIKDEVNISVDLVSRIDLIKGKLRFITTDVKVRSAKNTK